jgi:ATP-binding cassette subfamily C (CFTR/MRP) protein 2
MALSYGLSLNGSLVYSIQSQCIMANYIVSVERINQYTHIPSEAQEGKCPPDNWPVVGKVELRDIQVFVSIL